jgi:hypothetical protein
MEERGEAGHNGEDRWQHAGRRETVSDRVGGRVEVEKWDF